MIFISKYLSDTTTVHATTVTLSGTGLTRGQYTAKKKKSVVKRILHLPSRFCTVPDLVHSSLGSRDRAGDKEN